MCNKKLEYKSELIYNRALIKNKPCGSCSAKNRNNIINYSKKCIICTKNYNTKYNTQRYCSNNCRAKDKILIEEKNIQKENTNLKKYGVNSSSMLSIFKEKMRKTNFKKYGCEHSFQSENNKLKSRQTKLLKYGDENYNNNEKRKITNINRGLQIADEFLSNFEVYKRKVIALTKKNKKQLFENWDGKDYYDYEYIKNNFKLYPMHKLYPTIDHKISMFNGFMNNIPIDIIAGINNLCITKKTNNSKKNKNNELIIIKEN